ncbi:MAG: DUF447 domain-containing protein [Pseudomonadota bacterium]
MALIIETVVTTRGADGVAHIAPLGLIQDGEHWVIAPFAPSRTLDNLRAHPFACASHIDDVRVIAGCVTGRRDWPLVAADRIAGARLADAVSHWELAVVRVVEDAQRPRFLCRRAHAVSHAPWSGYNRAQAAVIELAVLTTRLHMLPPEKIEAEVAYLDIAISKTAGPREREAWGWLMERVEAWRRGSRPGKT